MEEGKKEIKIVDTIKKEPVKPWFVLKPRHIIALLLLLIIILGCNTAKYMYYPLLGH